GAGVRRRVAANLARLALALAAVGLCVALIEGCAAGTPTPVTPKPSDPGAHLSPPEDKVEDPEVRSPLRVPPGKEVATLAGGCFWCIEAAFQELRGVENVQSGYTGGRVPNPTYEQVCAGT